MEKIYEVTASNEEVCFIVCYATSKEKGIELAKSWIEEMGGSEEIDGVYAFCMITGEVDRIGFDDNLIGSEPEPISYAELGIQAEIGEPASYYEA